VTKTLFNQDNHIPKLNGNRFARVSRHRNGKLNSTVAIYESSVAILSTNLIQNTRIFRRFSLSSAPRITNCRKFRIGGESGQRRRKMRNRTKSGIYFVIQALAAAWFVAGIGVPSAIGDQTAPTAGTFDRDGSKSDFSHWLIDIFHLPPPPPSGPLPIPYPNLRLLFSHFPFNTRPNTKPVTPLPCSRPSADLPISASADDGPFMQLSGTALAGTTSLGTITMTGSNGSYVAQTITVTGAASTAGALSVGGFDPTNDEEIYGLAATTNNLATLIAELNAAVKVEDTGATATTVQSNVASVLAGDNIEVIFPDNGTSPNIFSYNLTGDTTGASITSITVVPEPAIAGTLVLGAVGFASLRKRRLTN
jgi:hypothetical protein